MTQFRTILADPPWKWRNYTETNQQRSPDAHYPCMSIEDLCALPVRPICHPDAVLLLWTTWPILAAGQAHRLMAAWGFSGKSGMPWIKQKNGKLQQGLGYHGRSVSEVILIGTRGKGAVPPPEKREAGIIIAARGRHSAKPERQYDKAELYPGPYLEIFSRPHSPRPGWTHIGHGVDGRDVTTVLQDLAKG